MSVVVGVDGSGKSRAALQAAVQEAEYRKAPVVAVMAYTVQPPAGALAGRPLATTRAPDERAVVESKLRSEVETALGEAAKDVELRTVSGLAGRGLMETARQVGAQLVVLATRDSLTSILGTVSEYVLRNAPCPVLVVPAGR
jgi:nucleotide-binding universal stress UspA family protein